MGGKTHTQTNKNIKRKEKKQIGKQPITKKEQNENKQ